MKFQEFRPEHYQRLADIYNSIYPGYDRTATGWRDDDERLDWSKRYFKRYACLNGGSNKVVGFGQVNHGQWTFHPKKFWIDLWVDPEQQKHGVGSTIYDRLDQDLTMLGAVTVWVMAREDKPDSLRFLSKRGFGEKMRAWESHLDPSQVNLSKHAKYSRNVANDGIMISTLAEEMKREPGWEKKLYELVQTVEDDIPRVTQYTPLSFEQWRAFEMKSMNLLPDGYMIAKDGSRYVGLSTVWKHGKKPGNLSQGTTGVLREYRGRGIAVALKTRIIQFARHNKYSLIRAFNDSTNPSMLGINMKLGFKKEVGWITFEKNIA